MRERGAMKIKLPERCFFTVQQLADRWEVSPDEIEHLFDTGQLTKRDKMAVLEGLEDAEYTGFEIHESPDKDFDLMPRSGPGYCIDGVNHGREVKVEIYLDEETVLLPLAQKNARITDFIEHHFPDSKIPVVIIEDVLEFERQHAIQERSLVLGVTSVNRGASEVPTVLGEQFKTAKPYYSIAELANILGDDYRRVADGLAASGAVMIYEGKAADLSCWERDQKPRSINGVTTIFVGIDSPVIPDPTEVIVYTDTLPSLWLQQLKQSESSTKAKYFQDDEEVREVAIHGATFNRLRRAIASFPSRYPDYQAKPPKLDDDVRPWLKETGLAENDAERRVFGAIIREHFQLWPDTLKT